MYTVVLDACVLFPNVLRDTLLTLAERELFRPLWSAEILGEVRRNVLAKRNVEPAAFDRHVLAAAIAGDAQTIVTFNMADFPTKQLQPHHVDAVHPD